MLFFLFLFMFRLDADTSLYSKNVQTNKTQNSEIVWKFKTDSMVYASPIVFENKIFIGGCDKKFYAIDAKTGDEKWRFSTNSSIQSTAAIFDKIICFVSGSQLPPPKAVA